MFPWGNTDNPLESLFKKPSFPTFNDQNPNPKHHDDSPFFSNFPSPFFDEHELPLNQILPQFNLKPANQPCAAPDQTTDTTKPSIITNNGPSNSKEKPAKSDLAISKGLMARKRTGKKDRHSKICTAQGIRDRRMRLSLQVARQFFDLQDMLGYDKASKTIEWLFNQSNKAIKELTQGNNDDNNNNISNMSDAKSESFMSECEVVSGSEENSNTEIKQLGQKGFAKKPRKRAPKPSMRESREMARARARCRTREKMMSKLGSSNIPFDHQGVDADYSCILHQSLDVGTIEKFLGNSSSSTISCPNISDYSMDPSTNFMGFLGNWDLINNDRLNSSNQFAVTNQVSLIGNPSSIYSANTSDFPLFHQ